MVVGGIALLCLAGGYAWRYAPRTIARSASPNPNGGTIRVVMKPRPGFLWDSCRIRAEFLYPQNRFVWSSQSRYMDDVVVRSAVIAWDSDTLATVSLEDGRPLFHLSDKQWTVHQYDTGIPNKASEDIGVGAPNPQH